MLEPSSRWPAIALARLRQDPLQTVAFAAIGALTGEVAQIPNWMERIERHGWAIFLSQIPREIVSVCIAALVITACFRMCTGRASELLRRPRRFFVLLLAGTLAATAISWSVHYFGFSGGRSEGMFERPEKYFDFWKQLFLWGGLIGWLFLLSMERSETRAALAGLLGRRSLLARQLANARLGHARAQFDPSMVARVLNQVHARYALDAPGADALLDHLISYLRLAMNRGRAERPGRLTEMALIRSLTALRAAEQGISIDVRETGSGSDGPSGPLFLVVSALLDATAHARASSMQLAIAHDDAGSRVVLRAEATGGEASASGADIAVLASVISRLLPAGARGLQHSIEAGVNQYVVDQIHG